MLFVLNLISGLDHRIDGLLLDPIDLIPGLERNAVLPLDLNAGIE
jgi:hypothetical protein